MAGHGHDLEGEQRRVFGVGQATVSGGVGSNLFVPHQGTIKARRTSAGEKIGDGIVDGVIGSAVVRPVVSLDVKRLRHFVEDNTPFGVLRRFGGGSLVGLWLRWNAAEIFFNE